METDLNEISKQMLIIKFGKQYLYEIECAIEIYNLSKEAILLIIKGLVIKHPKEKCYEFLLNECKYLPQTIDYILNDNIPILTKHELFRLYKEQQQIYKMFQEKLLENHYSGIIQVPYPYSQNIIQSLLIGYYLMNYANNIVIITENVNNYLTKLKIHKKILTCHKLFPHKYTKRVAIKNRLSKNLLKDDTKLIIIDNMIDDNIYKNICNMHHMHCFIFAAINNKRNKLPILYELSYKKAWDDNILPVPTYTFVLLKNIRQNKIDLLKNQKNIVNYTNTKDTATYIINILLKYMDEINNKNRQDILQYILPNIKIVGNFKNINTIEIYVLRVLERKI